MMHVAILFQVVQVSCFLSEPAILLMVNSMKYHPLTTVSLLDFLCRITPNFYPSLSDRVRQGIQTSLRQILKKGVLPSLAPIVDNQKIERDLKSLAIEMFPEFLTSNDGEGMYFYKQEVFLYFLFL